jgi:hypothetical protein
MKKLNDSRQQRPVRGIWEWLLGGGGNTGGN